MAKQRAARVLDVANAQPPDRSWAPAAAWAAIFAAALLAYLPSLQGQPLWDDGGHLTTPALQSWHGLWRIWFELGATQQYYPLLHSAFWLEHRVWGDAVLGYHLTNVVLHSISACLVVLLAKRLKLPGAWLAGFIFAVHPVCVEAVAWMSEQKSTLSGVFYLAAALTYLHFDRDRRKSQYFTALALFVLALLSKTVTATLPAALLVVLWWQRGTLLWRRDVLPLLPWIALAVPAGLLTAWVEREFIGARGSDYSLTVVERFLLAGRVLWFYAAKVVWPVDLIFSYPRWTIDSHQWWQYLFAAAALGLTVALAILARKNRGPLAAFLIFAGTLFPVLGFLNVYPFRYSFVADHFQYLACLAIVIPAASGLTRVAQRFVPGRRGALALGGLLGVTCGLLAWQQSGMYRDGETLYRTTLARNPDSFLAHDNLGVLLVSMPGRVPEAITELTAAVHCKPDNPEARNNLGYALSQVPERQSEAIVEYQTALRLQPDFADAHDNLGNAFSHVPGRLPDAVAEYQAALRLKPASVEAHSNLGNALSQLPGKLGDAIAEYRTALRINPDHGPTRFNLGNALVRAGRTQEAIGEYWAALRIDPGIAQVHNNLAYALAQTPDGLPEAISQCQTALRLDPGLAAAHQLMAQLQNR